jgi:hypothetical protein
VEAFEDGCRLGEERLGSLRVTVLCQPLAMLQQGDGAPEGDGEIAQHPSGRLEAGLGNLSVPADGGQARPDPRRLRLEEGGPLARWQLLDRHQQFPDLGKVAEGECSLGRPDEAGLDGLVARS